MSSASPAVPAWFAALVGIDGVAEEGGSVRIGAATYRVQSGVLRAASVAASTDQAQTAETFGFKWQQAGTFDGDQAVARTRDWLIERYGDVASAPWWDEFESTPTLLDAGCGAALSSLALFGPRLKALNFIGADISEAVLVARRRCAEHGVDGAFLQDDLFALPLPEGLWT